MKRLWALLVLAGCTESIEPDPHGAEAEARAAWLRTLDPPLDEPTMNRVIELLEDPNYMPRMDAVSVVGKCEEPRYWGHLKPRFKDGDPRVREQACVAAAMLGNDAAIPDLAELAGNHKENNGVRAKAVEGLIAFGDRKDVIRGLIDALRDGGGVDPKRPDDLIGPSTVVHAAHDALVRFTGQALPDDRLRWLDWYNATYGGR